jgi:type I restriction enzyme R subunit
LAREYPVFTSDTHLNDVASDFVEHYHQRWRLMEPPTKPGEAIKYGGNAKALLVCIDKVTCAKMAARIKARWQDKLQELQTKLQKEEAIYAKAGKPEPPFVVRLRAQIAWMVDTQIHPVFSPEQNEVKDFAAEGIDVRPLRQVMAEGIGGKSLDECFKDGKPPLPGGGGVCHVADRLRCEVTGNAVPGQAHEGPHTDAGHCPRQPGGSQQEERPHH